jgi:hypothetical protein
MDVHFTGQRERERKKYTYSNIKFQTEHFNMLTCTMMIKKSSRYTNERYNAKQVAPKENNRLYDYLPWYSLFSTGILPLETQVIYAHLFPMVRLSQFCGESICLNVRLGILAGLSRLQWSGM